ncbi:restriction endonuclease subunit S [Listeria innocua]|uniref:restriction endonuclease subunit S n=1 Tax=Listeria innocua TaxID=1642 RepID=UPI001627B573|nr:restriction endonuclease subunit S [Listeria innocua]MBC2134769.1 restriction endonuclease subunit S [Listeria innocua]
MPLFYLIFALPFNFNLLFRAWEQRKLRDIANYRNGKAHEQVEDEDGKYTIINSKFISTNGKVQRYTNEQVEPIFDGEIAMVLSDLPNGKALAKLFLVKEDGKYTLNQRIAGITPNENIDPIFLNFRMNRNNYFLKFDSGVTQTNLSKSQVENFIALYPTFDEQYKIGLFFTQLDDTIALHQRKLEALKLMKKGFLQQMFPKSEEDVPKIRFTDFNGNWRQCKLEEVADRVRGNDRRMELPTLTISASKGWLNQHERFFGNIAGKEQKNYTLLKKGQLSYNHGNSKSAKYGAVFVLRTYDEALVPRIYHSFKTNILANSDFIEYLFATKIPDRELGKIVSSGARMDGLLNINFNDFMSILIMLPFVEEQIKISNFLIRLDKIISLYQNKLDQLIKLKKAYLQYLFI